MHPRRGRPGFCRVFLTFAAFLLVAAGLSAQARYSLPAPLEVPAYDRSSPRPLEELRPFGWSPDGAFAMLTVEEVDGRGGVVYTYRVRSAVTDEDLYLLEDDSFSWPPGSAEAENPTAEISWARVGEAVSKVLASYGIVQDPEIAIRRFPIESPVGTVTADAVVAFEAEPEDADFDRVDGYEVWIRRERRSAKRIASEVDVFAFGARVLGYFASPFEPRILVLCGEERYVFEGTAVAYRYFGASLVVGFRPQRVLRERPKVSGSYRHTAGVAELIIEEYPDGTVSVEGYAESVLAGGASEGAVNVGEISGVAAYSDGRAFYFDGFGCFLELRFASDALEVVEVGSCGGLNVSFSGRFERNR